MIELHRSKYAGGKDGTGDQDQQKRIEALQREAQATRQFLVRDQPRRIPILNIMKAPVHDTQFFEDIRSRG